LKTSPSSDIPFLHCLKYSPSRYQGNMIFRKYIFPWTSAISFN
jgi:hypothetical protein